MSYGIKRGDIFYVRRTPVVGHEQFAGRPAIIVSNGICNQHADTVEVVYLTTQPKAALPTHVAIQSAKLPSTALCEQITTVSTMRLGDYYGSCTKEEMDAIDDALLVSLGLKHQPVSRPSVSSQPVQNETVKSVAAVVAERDVYRTMYESLLAKVVRTA